MIEDLPQFECRCSAGQVFGTNRRFTAAALMRTTCISGNVYNFTVPVNNTSYRTREKNIRSNQYIAKEHIVANLKCRSC